MAAYDASEIRKDATVSNLARLFQIVTNIFVVEGATRRLERIDGKEILLVFPKLGGRCATIKASSGQLYPFEGRPPRSVPAATIVFDFTIDDLLPLINEIIRSKATTWAVLKFVARHVLPGRVKVKGSLRAAVTLLKALMIGKHPMYKRERELAPRGDG